MTDATTKSPAAWVVLGGVHLRNNTAPRRPDDRIVLIYVPPQELALPSATTVLVWSTLGTCRIDALRTGDKALLGSARIAGGDLFPDAIAGPALRELVGPGHARSLVPLCYLSAHPGGGYHAYAATEFHPEDACFLRTTKRPVGHGPVEQLHWLEPALAAHAAASLALDNHCRSYRRHFPGTELEIKYTLDPVPDIWSEAMDLLAVLRDGGWDGCRPEYRNTFQTNRTDNHLFDVLGPASEVGYASFIPTVTAGAALKRKWFTDDAFVRREEIATGIDIPPEQFEDYLRDALGLEVRAMPPFRRVRYDIQCESLPTGHVFGIFFDHCTVLDAPELVLAQCELEYLRSRCILDAEPDSIVPEMERVDALLQRHLVDRGWARSRTFYSKRSFLRDVVAARPDLAPSSLPATHGGAPACEAPDTARGERSGRGSR